jgi:mannose-6-phosphate isomerase-like protein (cupin superfamily)
MLKPIQIHEGVPWGMETPFERWITDELHLPLHTGHFAGPLRTSDLGFTPWERKGLSTAFFDLVGAESLAGMYVAELAPNASSVKTRQLFDEMIYVISGRGSTEIIVGSQGVTFDWEPGSLFAVPLNATHQFQNASATEPARLMSVNTLPVMYNLLRSEEFLFDNDWDFDRIDPASALGAVLYRPDKAHERTAVDLYDTLFVPDTNQVPRSQFSERGTGAECVYFEMANSPLSAHMLEIQGGTFFNPHRHGPSGFVFPVAGAGYSLMWPEGGEPLRFDWPEDDVSLIVPPNGWWHSHFVTSPNAIHFAVKLMSRKHSINHLFDGVHKTVEAGGTVLRYQDLDPDLRTDVWNTYVKECEATGLTVSKPVEQ